MRFRLPFFWVPQATLAQRSEADRVPYNLWARQGLIEATSGASTDYHYVAQRLGALSSEFQIEAVAFDRWRIVDMERALSDEGVRVPLEAFGQGFKDMGPAVDELERVVAEER